MEISDAKLEELIFCAFMTGSKLQHASDKSASSDMDLEKSQKVFLQLCERIVHLNYTTIDGTADVIHDLKNTPLFNFITDDVVSDIGRMERKVEQVCSLMMVQAIANYNNLKSGVYFAYDEDSKQFFVCTKEFWEENKYLDDNYIAEKILFPIGFTETEGSKFEYEGDAERGVELLKKFGFTENKDLLP